MLWLPALTMSQQHVSPSFDLPTFELAGATLRSRLVVGTGKYRSHAEAKAAIAASGAEIVTVAVRRIDLQQEGGSVLDAMPEGMKLLPNTAGCYNVKDAIRTAHLGRELCRSNWVKLEVIGDEKTLMPDNELTLEAARELVKEGFSVFPYISDDVVLAKKLEQVGCVAVMPLGAPIGSGLGLRNPHHLRLIMEAVKVPVIVDAGVGTASDAALAMELGCSAVLINTAIAGAKDPVAMAHAMRLSVQGGYLAARAGRIERKPYATASSPMDGRIAMS